MKKTTQSQKPLLILSLIAMSLAASGSALAQSNTVSDPTFSNKGFYGGLGAGGSNSTHDNYNFNDRVGVGAGTGVGVSSVNIDDKDRAYKAFLGYQLNKNFAVEGGYFDLGDNTSTANLTTGGVIRGTSRYRGLNLDLVGNMPVTERFSLLGSVGAHYDRAHYNTYSDVTGATSSFKDNQGANYKYGVGAQYKMAERLYVRAGAERYHFKEAFDGRKNVNMYSLNLIVPFGARAVTTTRTSYREEVAPMPQPQPQVTYESTVQQTVTQVAPTKVTLSAESLFAFDRHELSAQGRNSLDKVVQDLQGSDVDMITITGYADRLGSDGYNLDLSTKRAQSVKAYLMSKLTMEDSKVTAVGKGSADPVTTSEDCKGNRPTAQLKACLQPDRRVEIEIVATKSAS
jgi:OOP family OmpA-OmpF porin